MRIESLGFTRTAELTTRIFDGAAGQIPPAPAVVGARHWVPAWDRIDGLCTAAGETTAHRQEYSGVPESGSP